MWCLTRWLVALQALEKTFAALQAEVVGLRQERLAVSLHGQSLSTLHVAVCLREGQAWHLF